jgi:hypothetical protein
MLAEAELESIKKGEVKEVKVLRLLIIVNCCREEG